MRAASFSLENPLRIQAEIVLACGVVVRRAPLYLLRDGVDVLEAAVDGVDREYGARAADGVGDIHRAGGFAYGVSGGEANVYALPRGEV